MPDCSAPTRATGGKYLILPPGYADKAPDGYVALQSDTFGGYMLFRSNLKSHNSADVARSIEYGKRFKVYPLAQASSPAPTIFTDAKDVTFDSTIRYDASFFEHLDRIVQSEPWLQRDRAMIDPLKSLGIEKGKPFKPDDASKALLTAATREAGSVAGSKIRCRLAAVLFRDSRWTFSGASGVASRQRRKPMPIRTFIPSITAASPIATPISASSGLVPASST